MAKKRAKKTSKKSTRPAASSSKAKRAVAKKSAGAEKRTAARQVRKAAKVSRKVRPVPRARKGASQTEAGKVVSTPAPATAAPLQPSADVATKPRTHLSAKDLEHFKKKLLALRDRALEHISFLAGDNLNQSQKEASGDLSSYGFHMADQGTDNFDREFSLALASNGQDVLYEINEALQRIENGTYGICELTGRAIERARLEAIPYTRYCREAQEQLEKRQKRFRSFAPTPIPSDIASIGAPED